MENFNRETMAGFDRILASDEPEMTKLAQTFEWSTRRMIQVAQNEIDLSRALQDRSAVVKHQIKANTLRLVREMFQDCYLRVTGERRRLWEA